MRTIDIEALRDQLMTKIDTADLREIEKVERYCTLVDLIHQLRDQVASEGASVVTENGSQRFVKSHPLMADIAKLNTQILSLEKSITFITNNIEETPKKNKSETAKEPKRGGLI